MAMTLETRPGRRAVARTAPEARDYMSSARGGWSVVSTRHGGAGMTAHRGVLHPDEYVNVVHLRHEVEQRLGFTLDELRSVYRQGRLSAEGRALRGRIDARFLELANSGTNLALLGRALGFSVSASRSCTVLDNAVARARAAA